MKKSSGLPEIDNGEIIDIHSHLGNMLYNGGGNVIGQKGVKPMSALDLGFIASLVKFGKKPRELTGIARTLATYFGRQRIAGATLENMQKARVGTGIGKSCCLPVPPNVCFDDLKKAHHDDSRVIPFTGVDFDQIEGFEQRLRSDVSRGAKGMKIHPIIQNVSPIDQRMFDVLDEFAQYDLPILFHTGRVTYYFWEEKAKENVDYGNMELLERMIAGNRARTKIILGHAGMSELDYVLAKMPQHPNVYVDTTFQHPLRIRSLIKAFGSERVLFGSDWPYGDMKLAVKCARLALEQENDRQTTARVLRENAKNLLHLEK